MKRLIFSLILLINGLSVHSQIYHPVHWSYAAKKTGVNEAVLFIKADIESNWHIYSAYQADGGPVKTSFAFAPVKGYELTGGITEPIPVTKYEEAFKMNVAYFENAVIFQQKVKIITGKPVVTGSLKFMCCNNTQCLPPETVSFSIPIK